MNPAASPSHPRIHRQEDLGARGPILRIVIITVVVTVALCLGASLLLQARERGVPWRATQLPRSRPPTSRRGRATPLRRRR